MSSDTIITPTMLVAPGLAWKDALAIEVPRLSAAELMRAKEDPAQAQRTAGRLLHRVCGHLDWPRAAILFDESDDGDVTAEGGARHRAQQESGS